MPGAKKLVCEVEPEILVDVPLALREEAQRIAKEENWTLSKAIVFLAERGVEAQRSAELELKRSYERLMDEKDTAQKPEARKDLIKAIFGPDSIATDQVF